eukprot:7492641-Pyramimonas_sp.AAC.1
MFLGAGRSRHSNKESCAHEFENRKRSNRKRRRTSGKGKGRRGNPKDAAPSLGGASRGPSSQRDEGEKAL